MNHESNRQKAISQTPRSIHLFSAFRQDFLASIVVFLVALPLCMGIAIASGVPVAAGLITGIVGGLVVGWLAGAPLQVSGPAAGLTVIVFEIVQEFGLEMLGLAVLMGGAIQLAAGLAGIGQWFRAVSPAVIRGMLAGIGVLIFASQFHVMVDDVPQGNGLQNLLTIPSAVAKSIGRPDLGTRELRQGRTVAIREIGELHRRQEAIAEFLPVPSSHALPQHEGSGHTEESTVLPEALAATQKALTADVLQATAALVELETIDSDGEMARRILTSCQAVEDASRAARQALEDGMLPAVVTTQAEAVTALSELSAALKNHILAAHVGILTIAVIFLWQGLSPKQLSFLPAPLLAVLVAACGAALISMPVLYVGVPDNLWSEIHLPTGAILRNAPWIALFQAAVVIALVASAETLLCATAVDQMQQGPRTRYDKELAAQGVGNMICGLVGALPMTGVIVRSTANIQSGGKTRLSAILHGLWLLVFVVFLSALLRLIPTSALAAILVYTGYKLVNLKAIKELRKFGWGEVAIYAATVVTIVVTDLLTGVIVGIALAAAKLLHRFSHLGIELRIGAGDGKAVLCLTGAATFIRLPNLASKLEEVPPACELHVDFEHLDYIDHACLDLLMNWAKQHEGTGGTLVIDWESLHGAFSNKPLPNRSGGPKTAT